MIDLCAYCGREAIDLLDFFFTLPDEYKKQILKIMYAAPNKRLRS